MNYIRIIFVWIVLAVGCDSKKERNSGKKNIVSFCNIYKDSVFVETFSFQKRKKDQCFYYYYVDNSQSFTLIYDSLNSNLKKVISNKKDTTVFELEDKKYYIQNNSVFPVFEFIEDKKVIDGAIEHYFNPQFGLLAQKSKTWRISKFYLFSESDSNYVLGQALLYNILNDTSVKVLDSRF